MSAKQYPACGKIKKAFKRPSRVFVNLSALLSIDHACQGCSTPEQCCCARYEVCADAHEVKRIIALFPEVVKFCPNLKTIAGYDNIFDEIEPGLFALDTDENGLCLLAYKSEGKIRCALHSAALKLGLPPAKVKPQACLLWPLSASEDNKFLSLGKDVFSFSCVTRRHKPARTIAPALLEAVDEVYGREFRLKLEKEAAKGSRRAIIRLCD